MMAEDGSGAQAAAATLLRRFSAELELREADLQARAQALQQREKKFSRRNPLRDLTLADVIITERLGRGAGGTTVNACLVKGWSCAVKSLTPEMSTEVEIGSFKKEIELMQSLPPHPNILTYLGHLITPEKVSLFTTRHSCSLRTHMEKLAASQQRFTRLQVCRYAQQIASGLAFLHRHSVLHRDIKSGNILVSVTHDNEVSALQIGDFDSAKVVLNENTTTVLETPRGQAVGTTGWQPPEIEGAIPDLWLSQAIDVFGFGMVLYELMTMGIPFQGMSAPEVRKAVLAGISPRLSSDEEERYGARLVSLFRRCCAFEPDERPSMASAEAELLALLAEQLDGDAGAASRVLSLPAGSAASLKDTMLALSALAGPQRRATTVPLGQSLDGDFVSRSRSSGGAHFEEPPGGSEWPVNGITKSAPSSPRRLSSKSANYAEALDAATINSRFTRVPSQPSQAHKQPPVRKSYSQSKLSLNLSKISKVTSPDRVSPRSKTTPNSPQDSPARDAPSPSPRSASNPDSPSTVSTRWPSQATHDLRQLASLPPRAPPAGPSTSPPHATGAVASRSASMPKPVRDDVPTGKPVGFLSFFSEEDIVEMNAHQFLRPKGRR